MNRATDNEPSRRARADGALIAAFPFLLWAPTLDRFFILDHFRQPGENRLPAPFLETAVVFHDSFGAAWQPFPGCSIKRIIFMSENREFNLRVILENRPRIVVNEILELYFNTQNPQELLTHDSLPWRADTNPFFQPPGGEKSPGNQPVCPVLGRMISGTMFLMPVSKK
jgi:hypothetical protein